MSARPTRRPRRLLVLLSAIAACAAVAQPLPEADPAPLRTPAEPRWQLLLFQAFRPGVLSLCEHATTGERFAREALPDPADPRKAWLADESLQLRWHGGTLTQAARRASMAAAERPRTDLCFALLVDGRPVLGGAVVSDFSARRFDFPALVRLRPEAGAPADTPIRYELRPRFPGSLAEPVPPHWRQLLPREMAVAPATPAADSPQPSQQQP